MHASMRSLAIERHILAGRLIADAIRKGAKGNQVMIGDVGSNDKCEGLSFLDNRVPSWLLSDLDLQAAGTARRLVRPDLMLIATTSQHAEALQENRKRCRSGLRHGMLQSGLPGRQLEVQVVEIGYTSEISYASKLEEKMAQHACLVRALEQAGFNAQILPVILGTTGGMFKGTLTSLEQLGVPHASAESLLTALSQHAVQHMQAMIDLRRRLERHDPPP